MNEMGAGEFFSGNDENVCERQSTPSSKSGLLQSDLPDSTVMAMPLFAVHVAVLLIALQPQVEAAKEGSEFAAFSSPSLTPAQAALAEEQLKKMPDDKYLHFRLLMYYYSSVEIGNNRESSRVQWARHVFWLIDHDPKSAAFDPGLEAFTVIQTGRSVIADDSLAAEARKHWERALASAPTDRIVLQHSANQLFLINPLLALPLTRKIVELNPSCRDCHDMLGNVVAAVLLDLGRPDANGLTCLHSDQAQIAAVRKELVGANDAEVLIVAGLTIITDASLYADRCKANQDEMEQLAIDLVRKALAIDPSLKQRYESHWIMQSIASKL
jgi:hypothetical protein